MITIYGSTLVEFTIDETSLLQGNKTGSLTLPANFFTEGKLINFKANGVINGVSGSKLTLKFKIGQGIMQSNYTFDKNIVDIPWSVDLAITCDTQNYAEPEAPTDIINGSYSGGGRLIFGSSTVDALVLNFGPVEKIELNTDIEQIIDFTAQWDKESLQNSIKCICADITTPSADTSELFKRVNVISNFASPNAGGVISGQYYDNSFQGTASATLAGAANRLDLAPFYTSVTLPVDQLGVACSTLISGALGKVVVYNSNEQGWPDQRLFYGATDLNFTTTGYKFHAENFTFERGTTYWIGIHQSSTATLRTINVSSAVNLGVNGSNGSNYFTILRRIITYASGAPTTWNFVSGDRVAGVTPPSIRFRAV